MPNAYSLNPPTCDDLDYIHWLGAAQKVFPCPEAERGQPDLPDTPAQEAFTRLLSRQPPDTEALWQEARPLIQRPQGVVIVDDSTLDQPSAQKVELGTRHWSGKPPRGVEGIHLWTWLWTEGEAHIPWDFRVYDQPRGVKPRMNPFRR